jgi:transcriptional regulator with XRE-family HTH domain
MATHRLANYLKSYRKRSGLTQREVAFLLGWKHGEQLLRYEKHHRIPPFRIALAFEAIFKVPVTELFAGANDSIVGEIGTRIETLTAELQKRNDRGKEARHTARKVSWLAANHSRQIPSSQ